MSSSGEESDILDDPSHKRQVSSRLDIWEQFVSEEKKYGKTKHRVATCKFCMKAGKKLVEIRGEKEFLRKHLLGCTFAPSDIKKKIAGLPDSTSTAAKRSSGGDVSVAKRSAKQASMMGFMDRPLTDNGTLRFEKLLAEFFLDCNVAFKSVESPSLANLLNFLRPSVKLHKFEFIFDFGIPYSKVLILEKEYRNLGKQGIPFQFSIPSALAKECTSLPETLVSNALIKIYWFTACKGSIIRNMSVTVLKFF